MNDFSKLSAESQEHKLAQLTPEELAECNAYLDEINARLDALGLLAKPVEPAQEAR